jgi:hypothetical protein
MALCFLLDENLRGALWQAIQQHNAAGVDVLDVLCVGDPPAPPLGTLDPDLLAWAEAQGRVLLTLDIHMVGSHLAAHWQAGHHIAGMLLFRAHWTIPAVIASLVFLDQAYDPPDFVDLIDYIP